MLSHFQGQTDPCLRGATDDLPEIFAIENTETRIFREHDQMISNAGCWGQFLAHMFEKSGSYRGHAYGMEWSHGGGFVKLLNYTNQMRRFAYVAVKMGDQKLVVSLVPHIYSGENGSRYIDQRFTVHCSDDNMIPIVVLFAEQILSKHGTPQWERVSDDITLLTDAD